MFNDFIGGGQVFLHKVRMFWQVFCSTIHIALLLGVISSVSIYWPQLKQLDLAAVYSYRKAVLADDFDSAINELRPAIGKAPDRITLVNAKTKSGIWATNIDPRKVKVAYLFKQANNKAIELGQRILLVSSIITLSTFCIIALLWNRFGKNLKAEVTKDGSSKILTALEVRKALRKLGRASDLTIGDMPLVKDKETQHLLITGSTGCGKTTLIHNLLPQIERQNQPAIIIDQTGEMIAKYYNPERADIIFNPFDQRSKSWNFWHDCESREELERFSKILIGFNRKQSGSYSDPFWELAAEAVFNACVEFLRPKKSSIQDLVKVVCNADVDYLKTVLVGTEGARYLANDSKQTASSIAAVLAANAKPLTYLPNIEETESFSMKQYFANIQNGDNAWLFLAGKPSSRSLTLPLISCLTELALSQLMEIGIDNKRRSWIVIDELPSLGKLPALSTLMAEGRKYGACVLAGLQSLNQLYSTYGRYDGSTIFGQFGTSFFFQNKEPEIAQMISSMCGLETITRQQKNTSYGANEFRDGVSYNEHQQKQPLVKKEDLASLAVGQCYVLLPEPAVRLSKMQIPEAIVADKNPGFIPRQLASWTNNNTQHGSSSNGNSDYISDTYTKANHSTSLKPRQKAKNKERGKLLDNKTVNNKSSSSTKNDTVELERQPTEFL